MSVTRSSDVENRSEYCLQRDSCRPLVQRPLPVAVTPVAFRCLSTSSGVLKVRTIVSSSECNSSKSAADSHPASVSEVGYTSPSPVSSLISCRLPGRKELNRSTPCGTSSPDNLWRNTSGSFIHWKTEAEAIKSNLPGKDSVSASPAMKRGGKQGKSCSIFSPQSSQRSFKIHSSIRHCCFSSRVNPPVPQPISSIRL